MKMLPAFALICVLLAFTAAEMDPGNVLPNTKICGKYNGEKGLLNKSGSLNVDIDEHPWMVALISSTREETSKHICNGVLINTRYVLTTAACAHEEILFARLGEWNRTSEQDCQLENNKCAPPHIDVPIELTAVHEEYSDFTFDHNIALLRLAQAVTYTDYVRPICLPLAPEFRTKDFTDIRAETVGWRDGDSETLNEVPLKVPIQFWSLKKCQPKFFKGVNESHICGERIPEMDSCVGESGSPVMVLERVDDRFAYFAVGIVSYGLFPCTQNGVPIINTRVDAYADWIQKHLEP